MKELKNIEEQFRQELLGMDIPETRSSDELWSGISSGLAEPQKRRISYAWLILLFALMSAAFGAGYASANRSAIADKMNVFTPAFLPFSPSLASASSLLQMDQSASSAHASSATLKSKNTTNNNPKSANSTARKQPSPAFHPPLSEELSSEVRKKSEKEKTPLSPIATATISHPIAVNPTTLLTQEKDDKKTASLVSNNAVSPLSSLSEKPLLVALTAPQAPFASEQSIHHLSTFQIGLSYTPSFMFHPSTTHVQTKGQLGHGVSLFAEKSGQRFHWGAGIQWQQMAYHFLYRKTTQGTYTYTDALLEVLRDENMTIIEEIYGDTTVGTLEQTEISFNNRYTLVGGTIYLRYSPFRNFPRTTVGLGLTGYKVIQQRGRYEDANNDYTAPITTPNGGLRTWGLMPNFTLEHTLPISPNWAVTSSLRISYLGAERWAVGAPKESVVPSLGIGLRRTFVQ
jgi:hypothetical protein